MSDLDKIVGTLRIQAGVCAEMGSPFYGVFMNRIADDLEGGGPGCELAGRWRGWGARSLFLDAVPIRIANTFNHLAMTREAPALSAVWPQPGRPIDADAAWAQARAAIVPHLRSLSAFLDHEPQTNEVRRSAVLLAGFLAIVAKAPLPLRCFEVGASAGLNVFWDRFHYRLGDVAWGDPMSPVDVPTEWSGPLPPLDGKIEVVERAACDRRPTDLTDPAQRRRLLANIWPDQFHRIERSEHAIAVALAHQASVDRADAAAWARDRVALQSGAVTVLYHSIFWQYLDDATRLDLGDTIAALGAQARDDAPFAWLRMEPPLENLALTELRLTLWPGGKETTLAEVSPHGAWVKWQA